MPCHSHSTLAEPVLLLSTEHACIIYFVLDPFLQDEPKPIAVDGSIGDNDYPMAVRCSGTVKPPAGDRFKLTSVDVWFEQLFSGLQMTECIAEAAT